EWMEIRVAEGVPVLSTEEWEVLTTPGRHSVPVAAVRVTSRVSGGSVSYSADTEPSHAVTELARGAAIHVHEATGGGLRGHTSLGGAADVAAKAGAGRLVAVHLPPVVSETEVEDARRIFPDLELGKDGARYDF